MWRSSQTWVPSSCFIFSLKDQAAAGISWKSPAESDSSLRILAQKVCQVLASKLLWNWQLSKSTVLVLLCKDLLLSNRALRQWGRMKQPKFLCTGLFFTYLIDCRGSGQQYWQHYRKLSFQTSTEILSIQCFWLRASSDFPSGLDL